MGLLIMLVALVIIGIGWRRYFTRKKASSGGIDGRAGGSGGRGPSDDHR